jgi:PEP-CTERM motif
MRRRVVVIVCLLLGLSVVRSASADPVSDSTFIQSGFYSITDSGDSYRFEVFDHFGDFAVSLAGSAMSVAGISQMSCYICDPGATFAIGRHTANPTAGASGAVPMGTGTFVSNSQTTHMRVEGWLTFLADSITLPMTLGNAPITFDVPFRARVSFNGFDIDNPGGGVFARWTGAGTAHVSFAPTADGHWSNATGELLRFDFSNATPVPEPASMFLIGTGLAGLGCALRRKA